MEELQLKPIKPVKPRAVITHKDIAKMMKLYDYGWCVRGIAHYMNLSYGAVYRNLKRSQVVMRPHGRGTNQYNYECKAPLCTGNKTFNGKIKKSRRPKANVPEVPTDTESVQTS